MKRKTDIIKQIKALTKEELFDLAYRSGAFRHVTQADINGVRFDYLSKKSDVMMEEALAELDRYRGWKTKTDRRKWFDAQDKFDKAMKLSDKALKILDR